MRIARAEGGKFSQLSSLGNNSGLGGAAMTAIQKPTGTRYNAAARNPGTPVNTQQTTGTNRYNAADGSPGTPVNIQQTTGTAQRFNPMGSFSPESLKSAQHAARERGQNQPVAKAKIAWGQEGWINPNYNPDHNKGGYHRFDTSTPGSGMQFSRTYADGARTFDTYNKLTSGQPGYDHAQNARNTLRQMGTTVAKATDMQKFEAMDLSQRSAQWKNTRPKRKFGIKDAIGIALQVGAFLVPGGQAYTVAARSALGAAGTGFRGGSIRDVALAGLAPVAFAGAGMGLSKVAPGLSKTLEGSRVLGALMTAGAAGFMTASVNKQYNTGTTGIPDSLEAKTGSSSRNNQVATGQYANRPLYGSVWEHGLNAYDKEYMDNFNARG
jgi:hypothetical protein